MELPVNRRGLLSDEWLAESIRFTTFGSAAPEFEPLYRRLTGEEPTQTNRRPAEGFYSEIGSFGAGSLFIIQQGGRLDIVYGASLPSPIGAPMGITQPNELVHVGPASAAVTAFMDLLADLGVIAAGSVRLAFSPTLVRSAADISEANKMIADNIPVQIDGSESDVLWQVNRPSTARSFKGRINRVVKWQTSTVFIQQILAIFVPQVTPSTSAKAIARCEIDVNTVQEGLPIEPFKDIEAIWRELVESTILILAGAD